MKEHTSIQMKGEAYIWDITDGVENKTLLRHEHNAIHPKNMGRIFARALAREENSYIHRIAFGNGGTIVNEAGDTVYRPPNDGQPPDEMTWDSRIYHETYSEIVSKGPNGALNPQIGMDLGSADINTGTRPGGGSVPESDPEPNSVRSTEFELVSQVRVNATINGSEPRMQSPSDDTNPITGDFTFDEIGLYSAGSRALPTAGYNNIFVGNKLSTDKTNLIPGVEYAINVKADSGAAIVVRFRVPSVGGSGTGGEILFGDLCEALNNGDPVWNVQPAALPVHVKITDYTNGAYPTITGAQTYGFLQFESMTVGGTSSVDVQGTETINFMSRVVPSSVSPYIAAPVPGTAAGVANDPAHPDNERERLLAHLIFTPVTKAANRTLAVDYIITIFVARTTHPAAITEQQG